MRIAPTFDLQSHSTWSDGALAPAEVVEAAALAGVQLLALTDHDAIDGTDEAQEAAEAYGVHLVPAVEISAIDPAGHDLHILGYGLDPHDPELLVRLALFRGDREERAVRMVDALRELGFEVREEELEERRIAGLPIGRPHIAAAVHSHPANGKRLRAEGIAGNSADVLVAYLIEGAPAFRSRSFPTVEEAIGVIHAAGGHAVWAHPYWDIDDDPRVEGSLRRFTEAGLDGVEAFYIEHNERQTHVLVDLAAELGLLTTGSADFHGPAHKYFSRFRAFNLYGREPNLGPIDPR